MTYAEKLKDPRWQKKRLEILERDGWACRDCGATTRQLQVHHVRYEKGEPWDTPSEFLLTVCEPCHLERGEIEHDLRLELARFMAAHSYDKSFENPLVQMLLTLSSSYGESIKEGLVYANQDA